MQKTRSVMKVENWKTKPLKKHTFTINLKHYFAAILQNH